MSKGMKWEYSIKILGHFGTVEGKAIKRIDGIVTLGGKKYYKATEVFSGIPGAEAETNYYRKAKDGIYVIFGKYIDRPEELDTPFPIEAKRTWNTKSSMEDGLIDINAEFEGFETLELIDKKYDNCLKINGKGRYQFMNIEISNYLVNKIGMVKSIMKINGGVVEMNLEKFTR